MGCGQYSKFDNVQLERLVESWFEKSKSFPAFNKCNIFYRKCSVDDGNISNQSTELKGKFSTKRNVTFVSSDSKDIFYLKMMKHVMKLMVPLFFLFIKKVATMLTNKIW